MIKIIADSTCDLTKELLEKYNVDILPLHVHLGDAEFQDGVSITPEEIFKWSDKHECTPKTSAMSIGECIELFEKYTKNGDEIICFSISDKMSSSGSVMRMAVSELEAEDSIRVIDSKNLSTGIAHLIIEASLLIDEGKSLDEITAEIEKLTEKVNSSFVVDTLTFLHRGGRCNSVAAFAGSVLKLHPKIVVDDGNMNAGKKYRGKMPTVIKSYVEDLKDELLNAKTDRVFITHSNCDEKIINQIYSMLEELNIFDEILVTTAGSVISSHCGPGTLGVLFINK